MKKIFRVLVLSEKKEERNLVVNFFEELNIPVFDYDFVFKKIINNDVFYKNKLKKDFANTTINEILNDCKKLKKIKPIIDLEVACRFESWFELNEIFKQNDYLINVSNFEIDLDIYNSFDYVVCFKKTKNNNVFINDIDFEIVNKEIKSVNHQLKTLNKNIIKLCKKL